MPKVIPMAAMLILVAASNYLVQFPINEWLTWGAFPYPITFLVNELTNRLYGAREARKVVQAGFLLALSLSFLLFPWEIALASATAFLVAQLLDISIFSRLRTWQWWVGPLAASVAASAVDTALFWSIAFGTATSLWITWALGDFAVKLVMDLLMLTPFRLLVRKGLHLELRGQAPF